ncbi:13349_t:CDS:2 [Entrophospora sp. SA101]|nr:13349_t:CDS:2 [Entrophospora sp. SA101]
MRAWRAMLRATGCTEITPVSIDKLEVLNSNGFLNVKKKIDFTIADIFWECFNKSLEQNKTGYDGKIRILSIIAREFQYKELQRKLKVSSKTISKARLHSKVNGPGCAGVEKPIITRVRITEEAKRQFEIFFADKNIVNLSSYRVNEKTGDPDIIFKTLE